MSLLPIFEQINVKPIMSFEQAYELHQRFLLNEDGGECFEWSKIDKYTAPHCGNMLFRRRYDFSGLDLRYAIFNDQVLGFSIFRGVLLNHAKFVNADLYGVIMSDGTDITDADFTDAGMCRMDLRGAIGVKKEQLSKAWFRPVRNLPDYIP